MCYSTIEKFAKNAVDSSVRVEKGKNQKKSQKISGGVLGLT